MPNGLVAIGKMLVLVGLSVALLGLLLWLGARLFPLGRLPGDLLYRKGNLVVYFPLVTCLLLSLVLTVLANLIMRR